MKKLFPLIHYGFFSTDAVQEEIYSAVNHIRSVTHFRNQHGHIFELLSLLFTVVCVPSLFLPLVQMLEVFVWTRDSSETEEEGDRVMQQTISFKSFRNFLPLTQYRKKFIPLLVT